MKESLSIYEKTQDKARYLTLCITDDINIMDKTVVNFSELT